MNMSGAKLLMAIVFGWKIMKMENHWIHNLISGHPFVMELLVLVVG